MSPSESVPSPSGAGVALPAGSFDPQSVEGLFLAALQKSPAELSAFLDDVCGDDDERRRRITALLRAYEDAGSFLETPAGGRHPETASREIRLDFLAPTDKPGCLGTIGAYEVIDVIGRGGMGIVLRALDPKLNRIVAVKVLAPELAANPNARRRFIREAQAAASISHPHVVTIHAVEEGQSSSIDNRHTSLPFLVMECVVGQSLQDKLDHVGSLRLTEILRIGHQISCGLAAAHKQGLIHRDIKPANILLENGVERVKITDFGLARLVDDVAITRTGEVSGTPQYMSPEQAKGERVDHRSDLFSLGCVLYAMCTGHSPFRGDSLAQVIKRVTLDEPRPIEEQNPETPRWLCDIVARLLAKSPHDRIQTAEGLADLLGEHLARVQHPASGASTHFEINSPQAGLAVRPRAAAESLPLSPVDDVALAASVASPARWMMATALLNWAAYVVGIVALATVPELRPGEREWPFIVFALGVLFVGSGLIWYGALSLKHLESYRWAKLGAVAAMLIGPGYLIGWPAGIWALSMLGRGGVRQSFADSREARGLIATVMVGLIAAFTAAIGIASRARMTVTPATAWEASIGLLFLAALFGVLMTILWLLLRGFGRAEGTPLPRERPRSVAGTKADRLRSVSRRLLYGGVVLALLGFPFILAGPLIGDGDIMEFGGGVVKVCVPLGILCVLAAAALRLVAMLIDDALPGEAVPQASAPIARQRSSPWAWLAWTLLGAVALAAVLFVASIVTFFLARSDRGSLVVAHRLGIEVDEVYIDGQEASTIHNLTDVEVPSIAPGMHLLEVTFHDERGATGTFKTQFHVQGSQQKTLVLDVAQQMPGLP
jgi:serine/threonine protein kinase